jgi:hypothetical protein
VAEFYILARRDFGISRRVSIVLMGIHIGSYTGISLNPAVEDACFAGCEDMTDDLAGKDVGTRTLRFLYARVRGHGIARWSRPSIFHNLQIQSSNSSDLEQQNWKIVLSGIKCPLILDFTLCSILCSSNVLHQGFLFSSCDSDYASRQAVDWGHF